MEGGTIVRLLHPLYPKDHLSREVLLTLLHITYIRTHPAAQVYRFTLMDGYLMSHNTLALAGVHIKLATRALRVHWGLIAPVLAFLTVLVL